MLHQILHIQRKLLLVVIQKKLFYFLKVDEMFRDAPIKKGNFDYIEFTRILKYGKKEKDDE